MRRFLKLAVASVALAVAVAYRAWPLPLRLSGRIETGDAWARADQELVAWILSWGAHALRTAPSHVFDANIFHPAPDSLARSEHLLGLAPIGLPVFAATGDPFVTYNATVLVVVLIAAIGTFVAVRAWSDSFAGALLAAVLFALAPMNVAAWNRLHTTAVHLFPWALYLMWRCAVDRRRRVAPVLGFVVALQFLAGVYVAFQLAALLLAFLPAVVFEARHRDLGSRALGASAARPTPGALSRSPGPWRAVAAVAAGSLALVPIAIPYLRVRAAGGLPDYSRLPVASLDFNPFATLVLLERSLPWPFWILALVGGLARGTPWRLRAGLAAVAGLGLLLALGPAAGVYALAQLVVPGFSGMRAPARFLALPLLALAMLSGLGVAALAAALPRGRRFVAPMALLAAVLVVLFRPSPPFEVVPATQRSKQTYAWLREYGGGRPVLEIPVVNDVLDTTRLLDTTHYMLGSTAHWLPLLNGYSGYPPASDRLLMTLAQRLPDPSAFTALRALADPGWLIVHRDRLGAEAERWRAAHADLGLPPPLEIGTDLVYRVPPQVGGGVLRPALLAQLEGGGGDPPSSLRGTPRTELPEAARLASVALDLPAVLRADRFVWLWLRVRNDGSASWPGLSAQQQGAVGVTARWLDAATGAVVAQGGWYPLAHDLAPSDSVRAQVGTWVPPPGEYFLEVGVVQSGFGWFADRGGRGAVTVRVEVEPAV